jgi:ribonucleotide monophosphatase NagD (HAD superfamily)
VAQFRHFVTNQQSFHASMAQRQEEMSGPQVAPEAAPQSTQVSSRMAWKEVMGANHPSPVKYDNTAVLILGWEENVDDTETAAEVCCAQGG